MGAWAAFDAARQERAFVRMTRSATKRFFPMGDGTLEMRKAPHPLSRRKGAARIHRERVGCAPIGSVEKLTLLRVGRIG